MARRIEERERSEAIPQTHDMDCVVQTLARKVTHRNPKIDSFIIRISGFGSLGKSTLSHKLAASLPDTSIIRTDMAMPDRQERRSRGLSNGDDPNVIHFEKIQDAVQKLLSGTPIPDILYDHTTGTHKVIGTIRPARQIIIDGACSLYPELRLPHVRSMGIFLDADSDDTRIALRNRVNVDERGYTPKESQRSMSGYLEAYSQFIAPTKRRADIVLVVDVDRTFQSKYITTCSCRPIRK